MNRTAFSTIAIAAIVFAACEESDTDPCADRPAPAVSRTAVLIPAGGSTNVSFSGTPPFRISSPPDPAIATAEFVDSTVSPSFVIIAASSTALIGEETSFIVSDDCLTATVSITIGTPTVISYADYIQPIWDLNCQARGCHPGGSAPFSLEPSVSWSNLYYAAVTNTSCGAIYRVVGGVNGGPGNPDSSLVYLVVSGRTSCPRMPFSTIPGDTLSQGDQDLIKEWILGGAPNN